MSHHSERSSHWKAIQGSLTFKEIEQTCREVAVGKRATFYITRHHVKALLEALDEATGNKDGWKGYEVVVEEKLPTEPQRKLNIPPPLQAKVPEEPE